MSITWKLEKYKDHYQMVMDIPPDIVKAIVKESGRMENDGYIRFEYGLTKEDILNIYNLFKDFIEKHEICY